MEWYLYPAIVAVGFAAGFINTLAGGGSALSLPFLIFLGLPAPIANGTNRIAILLQTAVAVQNFHKQEVLEWKRGLFLGIFSVIGGIAGAMVAVGLNEFILRKVIGGVLVMMLLLVIFKPDIWVKAQAGKISQSSPWISAVVFFLIGIYGGFIQVGTGFFLLAGLVLSENSNLLKANAVKVLLVFLYTPLALVVFIINGQVHFLFGFILAIGNMLGAWVGSKTAVKWGPKYIRYILILALVFSSAKLIGIF